MDFEKLGVFYLGKEYDLAHRQREDRLLMYNARDLTTHAVCVGMTGSGKTGLCLTLLEEAAIDHVPAIIIDPKGDITNLLLTFPDLRPEDFRPWVNADDARRQGLSLDEFAAQQADLWRSGLAEWGQDGERIRMLRETTDFVIYTPGSEAGVPVSILQSFTVPPLNWNTEAELLREQIQGTVSALLGLLGIDADPIRSREHILLANLFEHFWRQGTDLDLPKLILAIQKPPFDKLGVFDVDTFFPPEDRFELAMSLNNIIAAPTFKSWLQGQPLDISGFLATPEGKPRHAIFYIAHLTDAERMFFVTMLLNRIIGWMRTQPGTTSLRMLVYMDEIYGFFPPISNPPSKKPLLSLMKQGRAFGVGMVLATQNPADLDYKGLTNAGTWFIGRLQTERDKARLLDGLSGAQGNAGFDRRTLSEQIGQLQQRVFLLHNIHADGTEIFQTRWAMSYLRGPLTRDQVRQLMADHPADETLQPTPQPSVNFAPASEPDDLPEAQEGETSPPPLPPDVEQSYWPLRKGRTEAVADLSQRLGAKITLLDAHVRYLPAVLGAGTVHFIKQRSGLNVNEMRTYVHLLSLPPVGTPRWADAHPAPIAPGDLLTAPESEARYEPLPAALDSLREFAALRKAYGEHLYRTAQLELWYSPKVKAYSRPGESKRDFRLRLQQLAREKRDAEVDRLEERYRQRIRTMEDRLLRAESLLQKKRINAQAKQQEAVLSIGETMLGIFSRRRRSITAAASRFNRSSTAKADVEAAEARVESLQEDLEELHAELRERTQAIAARWEAVQETLESVPLHPRRADVEITLLTLVWLPHWRLRYRIGEGPVQTALLPADEILESAAT